MRSGPCAKLTFQHDRRLRAHALPRPICWSGVVLAPGLLAASVAVWKYEAATAAWMLALLWVAAASVVMCRGVAVDGVGEVLVADDERVGRGRERDSGGSRQRAS